MEPPGDGLSAAGPPSATLDMATDVGVDEFVWQKEMRSSLTSHVKLLEQAVEHALSHGEAVAASLSKFLADQDGVGAADLCDSRVLGVPQLDQWVKEMSALLKQHANFRVSVGVAGATGAGKTSLLNALLGQEEFLPSSSQEAATASICQIAWNHEDGPKKQFRGVVKYRTRKDIKNELDQILGDLKVEASSPEDAPEAAPEATGRDGEEDDGDGEDTAAGNDLDELSADLDKISRVWGLTAEELEDMTSDDILRVDHHANRLITASAIEISASDAETFSAEIQPYLDASKTVTPSGEQMEIWPLIDHVEVYLKAPILQNGVVLVDLPGLGDAVEDRASVAQRYYSELAVTAILTPIVRAADESTAVSLLNDNQALSMEMDDKLNSRRFCVVASKMDDISCSRYIKAAKCGEELHKAKVAIQTLQPEVNKLNQELTVQERKIRDLKRLKREAFVNWKATRAKRDAASAPATAVDLAQQAKVASKCLREQNKIIYKLNTAKRIKEKKLAHARGNRRYQCISKRNVHVTKRIQVDFQRRNVRLSRRLAKKDGDLDIKVFPVSTYAFWTAKAEAEAAEYLEGFPSRNFSGVPHLAAWIREATLPARKEHATRMLNKLLNLLNNVRTWSDEQCRGSKVLYSRDHIDMDVLQPFGVDVLRRLSEIGAKLHKDVEAVNPLLKVRKMMATCRPNAIKCVQRMTWNTHAAIQRRNGDRYISRGLTKVQHSWIQDLAAVFLRPLVAGWNEAFHHELPKLTDDVAELITECWDVGLKRLGENLLVHYPGQKEYLSAQLPTLHHIRNEVIDLVRVAVLSISTQSTMVHHQAAATLREKWKHAFKQSLALKASKAKVADGVRTPRKGVRDTRQGFLEAHAEKHVLEHYHAAVKNMKNLSEDSLKTFPGELEVAWAVAETRVNQQLSLILSNITKVEHSISGDEERLLSAKLRLQQQVRPHISNWCVRWKFPDTQGGGDADEGQPIPTEYIPEPVDDYANEDPEDVESDADLDFD